MVQLLSQLQALTAFSPRTLFIELKSYNVCLSEGFIYLFIRLLIYLFTQWHSFNLCYIDKFVEKKLFYFVAKRFSGSCTVYMKVFVNLTLFDWNRQKRYFYSDPPRPIHFVVFPKPSLLIMGTRLFGSKFYYAQTDGDRC